MNKAIGARRKKNANSRASSRVDPLRQGIRVLTNLSLSRLENCIDLFEQALTENITHPAAALFRLARAFRLSYARASVFSLDTARTF